MIDRIVAQTGRRIDESSPMVDARLPDGSRVNAIIPPLAITGPSLTIRKFSKEPLTMDDLVAFGTLSHQAAAFLEACVVGQAERPRLGRHRHRQDDDAQRAVVVHPRAASGSSRSRTRPS